MSIEELNKLKVELNQLQIKLNKLQIEYQNLEGYVFYLKSKKLSRGLTSYEYGIYEKKKEELKILSFDLECTRKKLKI